MFQDPESPEFSILLGGGLPAGVEETAASGLIRWGADITQPSGSRVREGVTRS